MGADGTAYFISDGTLYTSAKGSAKAAVKVAGADDIYECMAMGKYVYCSDGNDVFYIAPSGGKFVELG
ncbi:MAG: hypothetical protein RRY65_05285, partial [Pseudoflavonifractor sp.]